MYNNLKRELEVYAWKTKKLYTDKNWTLYVL